MAVVSAPGILFGAVGAAGALVEGLGALELFVLEIPTPPSLKCTPTSTYVKSSTGQPLTLAALAEYLHVIMLMSLGF